MRKPATKNSKTTQQKHVTFPTIADRSHLIQFSIKSNPKPASTPRRTTSPPGDDKQLKLPKVPVNRTAAVVSPTSAFRNLSPPKFRTPKKIRRQVPGSVLFEPSKLSALPPLIRFRRAVRIVQTLLRALTTSDREARLRNSELKFLLYAADDPVGSSIGGSGLYFDPSYYRAKKDMQLSPDAKQILSMPPEERTEEQKKIALLSLKSAVEAFAEFPIRMQRSLVSVGWYESYEASRVIIRQGHHAENFYMILTGTAVVTLSSQDAKTGETKVQTVAFLKKGNSFGELAIMHHSRRTATVSCQDGVELLAVGREDFVDIFMHRGDGNEPEFIQYLRTMEEFSGWPISRLPQDDPKICLYMYFRRGVVICKDSNKADWVYIVKSGTCRVLKKLQEVHPDIRGLRSLVPDAQMDLISPRSRSTASRHTPFPKGYKSRPSTQPNFRPSPEPQRKKSLPSIQIKSPDQVDRERVEFQKKLEEQRPETRPNGVAQENIARSEFEYPRSRRPPKTVYVQLQKLVEKDTFGLIPLILGEIEGGSMSTALVSDGAECILINKKFFLQHLTQKHRKKLRLMLRPYPTESSLQQRLQDQTNWQAYKSMMLSTFPSFSPSEQTLYL
ncbi:cyclic nucleotide-binding domain-containing protein 2-like isoform X3 [Ptychodera flava]|uniref:cyclic nucleotide-binding domain-containing protein 2-like isoform X3 n=1 Tax=Ptychodera flava TaxID=63121 RepID=UPI003969CD47